MRDKVIEMNTQENNTNVSDNDSAKNDSVNAPQPDQKSENDAQNEPQPESKSDKTIAKLQKRIASLSENKNDTQEKLDKALEEIQKLKDQGKPQSDTKSAEDDLTKKQAKQIEDLQNQLKRVNAKNEARKLFAEAGQDVDDNVLDIVVSNDQKKTYENIEALLGYTQNVTSAVKHKYYTDQTPRLNNTKATVTKDEIAKIKDPVKRIQAIKNNIGLYNN